VRTGVSLNRWSHAGRLFFFFSGIKGPPDTFSFFSLPRSVGDKTTGGPFSIRYGDSFFFFLWRVGVISLFFLSPPQNL